jgi:hypothetical protein
VSRRYLDPVLVALSDAAVLVALERAWNRVMPRSARAGVPPAARHSAYLDAPIYLDALDKALAGAWDLLPMLAARHGLDVDVRQWGNLLDGYTRALLMACEPHEPERLRPHLAELGIAEAWARPFLAAVPR